jgi:hypothetical protein
MEFSTMPYLTIRNGELVASSQPPFGATRFVEGAPTLLPPLVTQLHRSLCDWQRLGLSPGPVIPQRIWFDSQGQLTFFFTAADHPLPLMQIGLTRELAAWLVLLDQWMETFVVVARARAIWSVTELAGALTFMTPAYLPSSSSLSWERMAKAIAISILDGPLAGSPSDLHWQEATQ